VIAHPAVVLVGGAARPGPRRAPPHYSAHAGAAIAAAGIAVEISPAGLRKPVAEIYPSRPLAEMLVEAGVPFALSSDAHVPGELGYAYDQAVQLLSELGVDEIAVFAGRERRMEELG
jgi:histidinol-phosphatase (PHP family)